MSGCQPPRWTARRRIYLLRFPNGLNRRPPAGCEARLVISLLASEWVIRCQREHSADLGRDVELARCSGDKKWGQPRVAMPRPDHTRRRELIKTYRLRSHGAKDSCFATTVMCQQSRMTSGTGAVAVMGIIPAASMTGIAPCNGWPTSLRRVQMNPADAQRVRESIP